MRCSRGCGRSIAIVRPTRRQIASKASAVRCSPSCGKSVSMVRCRGICDSSVWRGGNFFLSMELTAAHRSAVPVTKARVPTARHHAASGSWCNGSAAPASSRPADISAGGSAFSCRLHQQPVVGEQSRAERRQAVGHACPAACYRAGALCYFGRWPARRAGSSSRCGRYRHWFGPARLTSADTATARNTAPAEIRNANIYLLLSAVYGTMGADAELVGERAEAFHTTSMLSGAVRTP